MENLDLRKFGNMKKMVKMFGIEAESPAGLSK